MSVQGGSANKSSTGAQTRNDEGANEGGAPGAKEGQVQEREESTQFRNEEGLEAEQRGRQEGIVLKGRVLGLSCPLQLKRARY